MNSEKRTIFVIKFILSKSFKSAMVKYSVDKNEKKKECADSFMSS